MTQFALQDIQKGILKAHNNGDTEGAKRLAAIYKRQQANTRTTGGLPPPLENQVVQQRTAPRDSAFEYGIDTAQRSLGKGVEALGRTVGLSGLERYGQDVVQQQDRDIARGGFVPKYNQSFSDTLSQGGIGAGLGWIGEGLAKNVPSAGAAIAGTGLAALTAPVSAPAAAVLTGGTILASGLMGAGEAAFEQEEKTGDYDASVLGVGVVTAILERIGAKGVISPNKLAKMSTDEITSELQKKGFGQAAKNFAIASGKEGITEGGQELSNIAATEMKGGVYTDKEKADRIADAMILGTSFGAGGKAVADTTRATGRGLKKAKEAVKTKTTEVIKGKDAVEKSNPEAKAAFAQRLNTIATEGDIDGNTFDPTDIDVKNPYGARQLVDTAHDEISAGIDKLAKRKELRKYTEGFGEKLQPTSEQTLNDRALVKSAIKAAKSKVKSVVTKPQMQALEKLAGKTKQGKQLINLVKESQELTKLKNRGLRTGITKYTEIFNPLSDSGSYNDRALLNTTIGAFGGGALASVTGGSSILGQAGIVGLGRALSPKGSRSTVNKFIQDNINKSKGFAEPTGLDLIAESNRKLEEDKAKQKQKAEQKAQKLIEDRETNISRVRQNSPATPNSPQFIVETAVGLPRNTIAEILRVMKKDPRTTKGQMRSINEYQNSVALGQAGSNRGLVTDLNGLIRDLKNTRNTNSEWAAQAKPDPKIEGLAVEYDNRTQRQKNYENAVKANQLEADRLINAVDEDTKLSAEEKAVLTDNLEKVKESLGSDPVGQLQIMEQRMTDTGVSPEAIETYFQPYVMRVIDQQKARESIEMQ
tara:strand:- start:3953 stop:6400 length:2448 start_codon:yes stop_codon:yes gene_type:complete